jgi:hypothetical protein
MDTVRKSRMEAFRRAQERVQERNAVARRHIVAPHPASTTEPPAEVVSPGVQS